MITHAHNQRTGEDSTPAKQSPKRRPWKTIGTSLVALAAAWLVFLGLS